MRKNIGKKIKIYSRIKEWFWITVVALVSGFLMAYGIYGMINPENYSGYVEISYGSSFLLVFYMPAFMLLVIGSCLLVAGVLIAWIKSYFNYGTGEQIEKVCSIDERLERTESLAFNSLNENAKMNYNLSKILEALDNTNRQLSELCDTVKGNKEAVEDEQTEIAIVVEDEENNKSEMTLEEFINMENSEQNEALRKND